MKLYLSKPRGFCAGVVRAIETVEEAIGLDREVGCFLPEAHPESRGLTLRQLLLHTAGLPPGPGVYKRFPDPLTVDVEAAERHLLAVAPDEKPGRQVVYSCTGYLLLGLLLKRVAATEYCSWRGRWIRGEVHDENSYCMSGQGGNAGLFIHSDALPAPGKPFTRAIEAQIMDGNQGDVFAIQGATMTPDELHPKGWLRALPKEDRMNPTGQWNHYRVECSDGMVTLAVNGEIVTRAYHLNPRKGYICLESEGSEVHFRNIRITEITGLMLMTPGGVATGKVIVMSQNFSGIKPLSEIIGNQDEGFRSLYNGLDLRGWKQVPGNIGHWQAKDWILEYDGKSEAEGDDKHLWTEDEFGNFILIVDWCLPADPKIDEVPVVLPDGSNAVGEDGQELRVAVLDAGDSGIYLRGSSKSQLNIWNWPVGSGEIWGYRTDKSMPAGVRRAATPVMNADNPVGRWNRFKIIMIDDRVTVELNGRTVINNAQLPGIPQRGPIALQHHGDRMQFANIYIKELD